MNVLRLVARSEHGRRIGQGHPLAKLLDAEVDQVLELIESGMSYSRIAELMHVSKSCIAHLAAGRRRCQTPAVWVPAPPPYAPRLNRSPLKRPVPATSAAADLVALEQIVRRWVLFV